MTEPSRYELDAWRALGQHKARPLSKVLHGVNERVVSGAASVQRRASAYLESHPTADGVVARGKGAAARATKTAGSVVSKATAAVPDGLGEWTSAAVDSTKRTAARLSRSGLSRKRVVSLHRKQGHDVETLADIRRLDLQAVDRIGRRGTDWYYPGIAALGGAGSGLVISGGQIVTAVSAGAAAAPSAGVVLGALAADTATVLTLATRAVGHVALLYGYDPEDPNEKIFALSVVNAGTAVSATAKTAAMADVSRLTQALIRGKSWELLNQSLVSKVSNQFAKAFSVRLTKKGLGKVVPLVGIALGGAFNWATLEGIFDAADSAYRRRFLLEKYRHLEDREPVDLITVADDVPETSDEPISVLDELAEAGGPDLREEKASEADS